MEQAMNPPRYSAVINQFPDGNQLVAFSSIKQKGVEDGF